MSTKEEATKAIEMLNGRLFRDRNLVVDEPGRRPSAAAAAAGDRGVIAGRDPAGPAAAGAAAGAARRGRPAQENRARGSREPRAFFGAGRLNT